MHGTDDFLGHEFARGDEFTSEMIDTNESLEPDGRPLGSPLKQGSLGPPIPPILYMLLA
ncbi:MAG: hypothetical protein HOI47_27235 [Candidatus Scalindua sp.]|nr:hypothetical protein [Candidatus Scalindua sp.]MBT6230355.1 hypothetical protein [Candidatus Scalindua sp.]MBT7210086.1 hypothetical protein [Candidatus Scalindua sp.]MBT7590895.1 hypothetical protein [Candidatus Scalindua sp.]